MKIDPSGKSYSVEFSIHVEKLPLKVETEEVHLIRVTLASHTLSSEQVQEIVLRQHLKIMKKILPNQSQTPRNHIQEYSLLAVVLTSSLSSSVQLQRRISAKLSSPLLVHSESSAINPHY